MQHPTRSYTWMYVSRYMGGQIGCAEGAPLEALVHVRTCNVVRRGHMCMCRWFRRPRIVDMDRYSGAGCLKAARPGRVRQRPWGFGSAAFEDADGIVVVAVVVFGRCEWSSRKTRQALLAADAGARDRLRSPASFSPLVVRAHTGLDMRRPPSSLYLSVPPLNLNAQPEETSPSPFFSLDF